MTTPDNPALAGFFTSEPKHCTSCKHFVHLSNVAHQNRCGKWKDAEGVPQPIALVRGSDDHCGGHGKHHEKHDA
jgi:hypothetical protein